ncbi:MAG: hypothetical protein ABL934_13150 [Lysobacteraceae bacterium]
MRWLAAWCFCMAALMPCVATAAERSKIYVLYFPKSMLRPAESLAIDHLRIVVSCAEFVAIDRIPSDWNVGVSRPISGQSGFDASAGHGASALFDLTVFDGAIAVSSDEKDCMQAKVTAWSTSGEWKRDVVGIRFVERRPSR